MKLYVHEFGFSREIEMEEAHCFCYRPFGLQYPPPPSPLGYRAQCGTLAFLSLTLSFLCRGWGTSKTQSGKLCDFSAEIFAALTNRSPLFYWLSAHIFQASKVHINCLSWHTILSALPFLCGVELACPSWQDTNRTTAKRLLASSMYFTEGKPTRARFCFL
jgi:hypothetical protein